MKNGWPALGSVKQRETKKIGNSFQEKNNFDNEELARERKFDEALDIELYLERDARTPGRRGK
jgi:hypothetical protein